MKRENEVCQFCFEAIVGYVPRDRKMCKRCKRIFIQARTEILKEMENVNLPKAKRMIVLHGLMDIRNWKPHFNKIATELGTSDEIVHSVYEREFQDVVKPKKEEGGKK